MGLWYWWSGKQADDNEEQYVNMGKEKKDCVALGTCLNVKADLHDPPNILA